MRYRNAGDLLPEALVKELQRYVQGEYLYIPTDGTQRKGWGERSGSRQMLDARNQAIRPGLSPGHLPRGTGGAVPPLPRFHSADRLHQIKCSGRPHGMGPPFCATLVRQRFGDRFSLLGGVGYPYQPPLGKEPCHEPPISSIPALGTKPRST